MHENDKKLALDIVYGDRKAFDSFYNNYFQKVYNYVYMQVRDHTATEDLTQEVFVSCFESLEYYEGRSSLICWVYGITRNTVHNWFRKKSREICYLEKTEESHLNNFYVNTSTPLSDLEYRELIKTYNKRFEKLTPESQDVFLKKHFQGMSIKEISKEVCKSQGAVKTDLYRAKLFLLDGKTTKA